MANVTLVMAPRERFSKTAEALETLLKSTTYPFELIYIDTNSPPPVRGYLRRMAREKGFKLIRLRSYLPDTHVRNIGLREVKTPYVCFVENDIVVRPGWLEPLIKCAEETKAAAVGPTYLESFRGREFVHTAGGTARVDEIDGKRRCTEILRYAGRQQADVARELRREPTGLLEFHCALLRTDVVRELGGFDEGVKNTAQHTDFCMELTKAGHAIYFEPASEVLYLQPPPFSWYDLPFYCTRWCDAWAEQTIAHFGHKWRLDPNDPFLVHKHEWTTLRRRQILDYFFVRANLPKVSRMETLARATVFIDRWLSRTIARPAPATLKAAATR
jgi:cellulose synthase/poly-beta-1,6-N-acetylglucosamine synthase-like glycosyltransferase